MPRPIPHHGFVDAHGAWDTWTLLPGIELHATTMQLDGEFAVTVFYSINPPWTPTRSVLTHHEEQLVAERRRTGLALTTGRG